MSIIRIVADLVIQRGSATCDEIQDHPKLAGYTRTQILGALKNARKAGLIHCASRAKANWFQSGSPPARHYPGETSAFRAPQRRSRKAQPPPASVWELAGIPSRSWPPVGQGRRFNLLGGWAD